MTESRTQLDAGSSDQPRGQGRSSAGSEARYRALFEYSPDMLVAVNARGAITAVNRVVCRTLTCSADALIGEPLAILWKPATVVPQVELLSGAECELPLRNGKTAAVLAAPLPGDGGEWLLSLRDVTAKLDLAQKLQQAERLAAIGKLAAGIANEINNPLAVLQLGLDALLNRGLRSPDAEDRLQQFAEHARRIARIVASLNQFARPRAPVREALSVAGLIDAARELAGEALAQVSVEVKVEPADLDVLADPGQTEQALANLLESVARSTPGLIHIRARPHQATCRIVIGVDSPQAQSGGELGFESKASEEGAGLDLASSIAWGLLRENGGSLRVLDRARGGGGFEAVLPLLPASPSKAPPPRPAPDKHGLRVLCVEDEPALRTLLVVMLQDIGHTALAAASAEEALQLLENEAIDAVLTDLQLPGQSGEALEETIRSTHPQLADRVILMSGMFHENPAGQRWLQKPFTFEALASVLENLG